MLLAIKNYLMTKKTASLQELSCHFQKSPDMMRDLLGHWVRKGCVRQPYKPEGCGTRCHGCPAAEVELYQWMQLSS
ncbi:MAG: hypothetical protein A3F17_07600 [Gammaproteobacteria bacterium RIFCSPHIGHO2_12_FULL_41_15]|nr:MAG: hypothetical protein A3F17_07600 [Gammaproteobacteria bacterium RIFCSPHIGHO2_12_FULL_41_15]